jgi:hypothetical protein
LESACAFILRVGSRTLSTWNSCTCHLCIIFGDAWRDRCHLRSVEVLPDWERLPRNVTVSIQHSGGVYFPGETPPHGQQLLGWPFLSLSLLVKEGFSLGKLRKSSKPTTAEWQAIW